MRNKLLLFTALLFFAACKHNTPITFKEVQVPGKFTLQIPSFMEATTELFNGGKTALQYQNDSLKLYIIAFDTGRQNLNEKTLRQYYDSVAPRPNEMGASLDSAKYMKINNDSAIVVTMTASPNGSPAYYKIATIATPARFYYFMIWCPQTKKEEMKDTFDKVLNSFHDINHIKA